MQKYVEIRIPKKQHLQQYSIRTNLLSKRNQKMNTKRFFQFLIIGRLEQRGLELGWLKLCRLEQRLLGSLSLQFTFVFVNWMSPF